jgi:hypothetical protein
MLSEYEMSGHLAKKGFMVNYLLWHHHGKVWPAVADESDGNDDVDQMNDMVADIGRGYNMESEDPPSEVQYFYLLLTASEEKVHDDTDMTVLQAVTRLMDHRYNSLPFSIQNSNSNSYSLTSQTFMVQGSHTGPPPVMPWGGSPTAWQPPMWPS